MAFSALWRSLLRVFFVICVVFSALPDRALAFDVNGPTQTKNSMKLGNCTVYLTVIPGNYVAIEVSDGNSIFLPGKSRFDKANGGYYSEAGFEDIADGGKLGAACGVTVEDTITNPISDEYDAGMYSSLTRYGFTVYAWESNGNYYSYTAVVVDNDPTEIGYVKTLIEGTPTLTVAAMPDVSAVAEEQVSITGQVTYEAESYYLSYSWTQVSGPTVTLENANQATVTFTAPTLAWNAPSNEIVLNLSVSDPSNTVVNRTVKITVEKQAQPALAATISGPTAATSGEDVGFSATVTNDVGAVGYIWQILNSSGTEVVQLADSGARNITFAAPSVTETTDFTVKLRVTDWVDGNVREVTTTSTLRVSPASVVDPAPVITAFTNRTADAEDDVAIPASVTYDGDLDTLTYAWSQVSGPTVSLNGSDNSTVSFTAPSLTWYAPSNQIVLSLTVTDPDGDSDTETVTITVPRPAPPNLSSDISGATTYTSGEEVSLTALLTGNVGTNASYSWVAYYPSNPTNILFSSTNGASFSFTAPSVEVDTYIAVRVTYYEEILGEGRTTYASTTITIIPAAPENTAPVADAGDDRSVAGGELVGITGSATDDGNLADITYSWEQLDGPTVTLTGADQAAVSFTAPVLDWDAESNQIVLQLTVTDAEGAFDTDTVTITVAKSDPPELSAAIYGGTTFTSGETVSFSAVLTGKTGSDPHYVWSVVYESDWSNYYIFPGYGGSTFSFTAPQVEVATKLVVRLSYFEVESDEPRGATTSSTITILPVAEENTPPVADAGEDRSVAGGELVEITGSATDDGDLADITYSWEKVEGPDVTLTGADTATVSFTAPTLAWNAGSNQIVLELTVTDAQGATNTDSVIITVDRSEPPPLSAQITGLTTFTSGETVSLAAEMEGNVGEEPDYDWLVYREDDPANPLVEASEGALLSFTAPEVEVATTLQVRLTYVEVINNSPRTANDSYTITILPAAAENTPPVADAGEDQDFVSGETETVTLSGSLSSDPDGDTLTYAWTQESGPEVALTSPGSATTTFIPPTLDAGDDAVLLVFRLTVTDEKNASRSDTISVRISPPDAPIVPTVDLSASAYTITAGDEAVLTAATNLDEADIDFYEWEAQWVSGDDVDFILVRMGERALVVGPDVSQETVFRISVTVNSVNNEPVTDSVLMTFLPGEVSNSAELTVVIPSSETVSAGEEITFSTGIDGEPDGEVSYAWTVKGSSGEAAITLPSTTSMASFTAPTVAEDESWTVTVYLLIDGVEVDSRSTFFTVLAEESTPVEEETEEAEIVAEVEEQVVTHAETQLTQIIGNQPTLDITIVDGNADLTVSSMGGTADLFTGFSGPVWAQLRADWSTLDGVKSGFVLGSVGTHWQLGERTFLGLMLQADQTESDEITSLGWLVGPYAVFGLPDKPITLQARFLTGSALNKLADGSEYDSDRTITQFALSGKVDRGEVQIQPSLKLTYGRSLSEAFTNAAGLSIAAQEATLAQAESGVSVSFPVQVASGSLRLSAGLSDVWADTSDASSLNGHRGKLSFGGKRVFASGAALSFQLVQDGIGAPDYESTSATVNFSFDF